MYTPGQIALALAVVFVASSMQGLIGFGLAVLSTPLLTLIDADMTPIPILFLALPLTLASMLRERHDIDTSGVGWIIAGRVPGAVLGAWVLTAVDERILGVLIGVIVVVAVTSVASGWKVRLTTPTRFLAGLTAGFTGSTASIGGPPIALLYRGSEGPTVRSTLGAIFSVGIVINVIALTVTGAIVRQDLLTAVLLAPAMAAGFFFSSLLTPRVPMARIRTAILAISALAGTMLVLASVAS